MMKRTFLIFFVAITAVLPANFSLETGGQNSQAQNLEIQYPSVNIDGQQYSPGPQTKLADYVNYVFMFIIGASGVFALAMITAAGFQYVASSGEPEKLKDARNRISSALLGLVILFTSWILLNAINPRLVLLSARPGLPAISSVAEGIYLCDYNAAGDFEQIEVGMPAQYENLRTAYLKARTDEEAERIAQQIKSTIIEPMDGLLKRVGGSCVHFKSGGSTLSYNLSKTGLFVCAVPVYEGATFNVKTAFGAISTGISGGEPTGGGGLPAGHASTQRLTHLLRSNTGSATCEDPGFIPGLVEPFEIIPTDQCRNCSVTTFEEESYNRGFATGGQGGKQSQFFQVSPGGLGQGGARLKCETSLAFPPKSIDISGEVMAVLEGSRGSAIKTSDDSSLLNDEALVDWVDCEQRQSGIPGQPAPYKCPAPTTKGLCIIGARLY